MSNETSTLFEFLHDLRRGKIHYRLSQHRDNAIMVEVAVPGERWEVEFFDDGGVDVEVFRSGGEILDASVLGAMVAKHSDRDGAPPSFPRDQRIM